MHSLAVVGALLFASAGAAIDADAHGEAPEAVRLSSGTAATAARFVQPVPTARVWVDEDLDHFYPGDRVGLQFRTSEDAYVAIMHVDTEGRLELVYPASRWDDERVLGMRTYSLPLGARGSRYSVSRAPGIGYFYIVASRYPLDLSYFFSPRPAHIGLFGPGRFIRGDPFWAMEQLAMLLIRDGMYGRYASDVYSYHVGGVHRYPTFACYDRFSRFDPLGSYPYYTSCSDLQRLLTRHPHYYDTRRYRGDRRVFVRELDRLAPLHGFKERPDQPARFGQPTATESRGIGVMPLSPGRTDRGAAEPTTPARQRPTLERRPEPREAEPRSTDPRSGGTTPTRATPTRETGSAEPRGSGATPTRATPTRAAPTRETGSTRSGNTGATRAAPARDAGSAQPRGSSTSPTRAAPQRQGSAAPTRPASGGRSASPAPAARGRGG